MGVSTCIRMIVLAAILAITYADQSINQENDAQSINQEIDAQPTEIMYQSTIRSINQNAQHAVLAYLTPWNPSGFETALKSVNRFTHLSPVWHQMKIKSKGKGATLVVDGLNDPKWLKEFHTISNTTKLVPRVVIEMNKEQQLKLAKSLKMQNLFIRRILSLCTDNMYDGIVLEATDFHALAREDSMETLVSSLRFIVSLGQHLHRMIPARQLIFVVRPWYENSPYFQYEDALPIGEAIDYYSLMTYDYSTGSNLPGPNSPITWMRAVVQKFLGTYSTERSRSKVLMGMNFYGMIWEKHSVQRPIIGQEFVNLCKTALNVDKIWQNDSLETHYRIDEQYDIFYPDIQSINARVNAANEWGVGLAIWELGQGTQELVEQL